MDELLRPPTAKRHTRNSPLQDSLLNQTPPPCRHPGCLNLLCLTIGDSNLSESSFYLSHRNALHTSSHHSHSNALS